MGRCPHLRPAALLAETAHRAVEQVVPTAALEQHRRLLVDWGAEAFRLSNFEHYGLISVFYFILKFMTNIFKKSKQNNPKILEAEFRSWGNGARGCGRSQGVPVVRRQLFDDDSVVVAPGVVGNVGRGAVVGVNQQGKVAPTLERKLLS